jgi:hypothetical protein
LIAYGTNLAASNCSQALRRLGLFLSDLFKPLIIIEVSASMYFTVLGDMTAALSAKKVFVIAEKFFASLFGQSLVLAKIINPKILDQDAARSFVILLPTKRPCQVEVRNPHCPSRMPTLRFDESKPAKPVVDVKPILDL